MKQQDTAFRPQTDQGVRYYRYRRSRDLYKSLDLDH